MSCLLNSSYQRETKSYVAKVVGRHGLEGFSMNLLNKYLLSGDFISVEVTGREDICTTNVGLRQGVDCSVCAPALAVLLRGEGSLGMAHPTYTTMGSGTSLVVQWLRLRLTMQRVLVRFLVRELRSHMPHAPLFKKELEHK